MIFSYQHFTAHIAVFAYCNRFSFYKRRALVFKAVKAYVFVESHIHLVFGKPYITAHMFRLNCEIGGFLHFENKASRADCVDGFRRYEYNVAFFYAVFYKQTLHCAGICFALVNSF